MSIDLFANRAQTTVTSGGTTAPASGTQETWTVASSSSFPAASSSATPPTQFRVIDRDSPSEVMIVTNVSGTTWTVLRGQEATTPVAHSGGFTVQQIITAAGLDNRYAPMGGSLFESYVRAISLDQMTPPTASVTMTGTAGAQEILHAAPATAPDSVPILSQISGGWIADSNTWTRTSATTFTVPGNFTAQFVGGTKLKWTDSGGTKYGVVQSSAYASSTTTVTMITTSSYTMASGTISSPEYSYSDPPDFPASFAWTPTWTGFSSNPASAICVWSVVGAIITFRFVTFGYGTSNSATMTMSLPAPIGSGALTYVAMGKDGGTFTTLAGAAASVGGTTLAIGRIDNAAMAGSGSTGFTSITGSYPLR